MKKKILAFVLMSAMAVSMITGCGEKEAAETDKTEAAQTEEQKDTAEGEYQFVSAEDAVTAAADGKTHVLDVREWANYVGGRIANSEWCPIFPLEDEDLVEDMTEYAEENLKDGEKIYLVCNSGQRGAQKATTVLQDAGIDSSLIYTVEGGAKALAEVNGALTTNRADEAIEWQYAKAADVLAAEDAQIVDVRDADTYAAGHLDGSINVGLKEIESADAQTAMFEAAEELDKDEPVYFLCYSGNKCAKTGISVLKDAGFDLSNLYIIENGAKDADIQAAFVK